VQQNALTVHLLHYHYVLLEYPTIFGPFWAIVREITDTKDVSNICMYAVSLRNAAVCIQNTVALAVQVSAKTWRNKN
jgi:hypothetical protein